MAPVTSRINIGTVTSPSPPARGWILHSSLTWMIHSQAARVNHLPCRSKYQNMLNASSNNSSSHPVLNTFLNIKRRCFCDQFWSIFLGIFSPTNLRLLQRARLNNLLFHPNPVLIPDTTEECTGIRIYVNKSTLKTCEKVNRNTRWNVLIFSNLKCKFRFFYFVEIKLTFTLLSSVFMGLGWERRTIKHSKEASR